MRHMGANFYDHFKNRDLMLLFKRLCAQNQQRKFNALWKLLDEMTAKHIKERHARVSSSNATQAAESSGSAVKPFTHWIRDAPKEKWSLLYDTDGSRYGIMTTNVVESYNMVMHGVRCRSLVGIVAFSMYGVRSSANNFCFFLFHKRGSRMYLGPGDIRDRSLWNVHSELCAAMVHSRSRD